MRLLQGEVKTREERTFLLAKWKGLLKKSWRQHDWKCVEATELLPLPSLGFDLGSQSVHYILLPFWTHKMLLLLFKKKKSWMTLAFTGVSHWLEPSVAWLRGSKQILRALCSAPLYEAPWAIAVPVLVLKQGPAAWAELLLSVCSHWGMMWMRQHFPENRLLVAHKAFSLVTSAVMNASHSKRVEPRSEMLSQPSGCCWMRLWTWDFPLKWIFWS